MTYREQISILIHCNTLIKGLWLLSNLCVSLSNFITSNLAQCHADLLRHINPWSKYVEFLILQNSKNCWFIQLNVAFVGIFCSPKFSTYSNVILYFFHQSNDLLYDLLNMRGFKFLFFSIEFFSFIILICFCILIIWCKIEYLIKGENSDAIMFCNVFCCCIFQSSFYKFNHVSY